MENLGKKEGTVGSITVLLSLYSELYELRSLYLNKKNKEVQYPPTKHFRLKKE